MTSRDVSRTQRTPFRLYVKAARVARNNRMAYTRRMSERSETVNRFIRAVEEATGVPFEVLAERANVELESRKARNTRVLGGVCRGRDGRGRADSA
jgi:hypothetical protein